MAEKKKLNLDRVEMPKQAPFIRKRNFREVALGYTAENAIAEASRCLNCKKPFCVEGCPVEIDIPVFIQAIAAGDFAQAIKTLKEKNCLPAVCGRVCPQEEQCESKCILLKKGAPISIGRLERFAADWEADQDSIQAPLKMKKTGKKVAVIGS
jgi:glutamate synthase (NADPH/NADH) small chain